MIDWLLRVVKGMFIGSGFILPGVSGGALAAVFGIYERIISFLSNITRDFKKNVIYFIPIALGGIAGVLIFSKVLGFLLDKYEIEVLWFFIGCIVGTMPLLWRQAGKKGRKTGNYVSMAIAFAVGLAFMMFLSSTSANMPQNFGTWVLAGGLIGLGVVVPGLSPSNFLVFFGMYGAMTEGIGSLNFSIIIPIGIGALAVLLLFSRLMEHILAKAYSTTFHIIVGVVLASTIMIVPLKANYFTPATFIYILAFAAGIALGLFMGWLEKKFKSDELVA